MRYQDREIVRSVDLCDARGRLDPAAVGWTRHPVHCCNLSGRWPRKKRWNYWCVISDTHLFSVTISNVDYAGLLFAYLLDFETKEFVEETVTVPFARGLQMNDTVQGVCAYSGSKTNLRFEAANDETSLHVDWKDFGGAPLSTEIRISYPENHETLSVVIPWDEKRFQFTSKHHCLRADATLNWGNKEIHFTPENSFACLDFGRGIWPYATTWNWGGGSGSCDGRIVGLNLGAGWTDGTGLTENGVVVDGRLRKTHGDLAFTYDSADFMKPWTIGSVDSDEIDLVFTPFYDRAAVSNVVIIRSQVHQMIGTYSGTVLGPDDSRVEIDGLIGWAEEHIARW